MVVGLKDKIPDLNERINHIFKHQLYGIAITELTALMSRRTVYCSKGANGKYSISNAFDTVEGNIIYSNIEHEFNNRKCIYCGASEGQFSRGGDLEQHAYQFIHNNKPDRIFNMKFEKFFYIF